MDVVPKPASRTRVGALKSMSTRFACAWAAPDCVNLCHVPLASPDPWMQAPPTPPAARWARPRAATTRSLHRRMLRLSPGTALLIFLFLASILAPTSDLPTCSLRTSATPTQPSTSRSAHSTLSRLGLTQAWGQTCSLRPALTIRPGTNSNDFLCLWN